MAKRKTRDRIKDQRIAIYNALDRIDGHLQNIDELADGRSDVVEKIIPNSVLAVEFCRNALKNLLKYL